MPWTPPEASQENSEWAPPEAQTAEAPALSLPSNPEAKAAEPIDRWHSIFSDGLENLNLSLTSPQMAAMDLVDKHSDNPADGRARAINQAYISERAPSTGGNLMDYNWDAIKQSYQKNELGLDEAPMSDPALFSAIGKHYEGGGAEAVANAKAFRDMGPMDRAKAMFSWLEKYGFGSAVENAAEVLGDVPRQMEKSFESVVGLPKAPTDLPDLPALGVSNPAFLGAVWNGIKPSIEGFLSPGGVATLGLGAELKAGMDAGSALAKTTLFSMEGLFTSIMGYQLAKGAPNKLKVINDPSASFQDKVTAGSAMVAEGTMTLAGALGMALTAMPRPEAKTLLAEMKDATPAEAAETIRAKIEETPEAPHNDSLNVAALEFEKVAQIIPEKQEMPAHEASSFDDLSSLPREVGEVYPDKVAGESEAKPSKETSTEDPNSFGIKNVTVDAELERLGMKPTERVEKTTEVAELNKAKEILNDDPKAGERLISEIKDKPRPMTSTEDAVLTVEMKIRRDELRAAREALKEADASGDADQIQKANVRAQLASDAFFDAAQADKSAGTKNAQGLALRKLMIREDFSLENMETRARMAKGEKLTPEESAKIKEVNERVDKTSAALDQRAKQVREAESAPRRRPPKSGVMDFISKQADAARQRLKDRATGVRASATFGADVLADYAIIGAEHLAKGATDAGKWTKKMIEEHGPAITEHLGEIWKRAKDLYENAEVSSALETRKANLTKRISEIEKRLAAGGHTDEQLKANRPAIEEIEGLEQKKASLQQDLNNILRNKDTVRKLEAAIEEKQIKIATGELSARESPVNRPSGNETIETLRQERDGLNEKLAEARREAAKPTADEITKRKVEEIQASIDKIQEKLKSGDLSPMTQTAVNRPQAEPIEVARQELDALREKLKEVRKEANKPTDEELTKHQVAAIEKQIALKKAMIASGKNAPKSNREVNRPAVQEVELAKQRLAEVNADLEELRKGPPKSATEKAMEARKTRLSKSTQELQKRTREENISKPTRQELKPDEETLRLQAENNRAKEDFQRLVKEHELANQGTAQKLATTFGRWRRGFLLSSPTTLAKLSAAAVWRMGFSPAEEAVGGVLSHLPGFSRVADLAPREGHFSANAEINAITEAVTTGMRDAWDMLTTGKARLSLSPGHTPGKISLADVMPRSAIDFFGNIHGALKSPVKRSEFARSFAKRMEFYADKGLDPKDPELQARVAVEAYKDSNRAIFMQDNMVVDAYKRALSRFMQVDKKTGQPSAGGLAAATAMQAALPIVKIPTNIVGEIFTYAGGTLSGSTKLAVTAITKGIDKLQPEEADMILRHLKKGLVGSALMAYGYFNSDQFGGYYQHGEKRHKDDVKPKEAKFMDHDVPSSLLHNPAIEQMQIGASLARIAESKLHKHDREQQGMASAVLATALGVAEEVPFAREAVEAGKIFDPNERQYASGELLKSIMVPAVVDWAARHTDTDEAGEIVKRKPKTVMEHIESGIPGLREELPKAKK